LRVRRSHSCRQLRQGTRRGCDSARGHSSRHCPVSVGDRTDKEPTLPVERTPLRARMTARAVDEPHRTASPLELLFDLTLVVAVAAATAELAHSIEGGHLADGVLPFLEVFFAIWWAWMNFTW